MTNEQMAASSLRLAARILGEARRYRDNGAWSLAIRRSQDVVELALKAVARHPPSGGIQSDKQCHSFPSRTCLSMYEHASRSCHDHDLNPRLTITNHEDVSRFKTHRHSLHVDFHKQKL